MESIEQASFERLLTTMEGTARANTELSVGLRELSTSVQEQGRQVGVLGERVEANTLQVKRLCDAQEAETARRLADEAARKDAAAVRAGVFGKLASGAWGVMKNPTAVLLMACATWLILNWLHIPVPGAIASP